MAASMILALSMDLQLNPQYMGDDHMGGMYMGMHWGWWLITVLILPLLIALVLQVVGRNRD